MPQLIVSADDGEQLYVAIDGEGPALVLCHGGPGMWDYFGPVVESVRDLASVVTWDQRGCGRSSGDGPHTVPRYVEDLEAIREALGLTSWFVGGHSWGATLALMYALAHPRRCDALLYTSGTGLGREWNAAYHLEADRRRGPIAARLAQLETRQREPHEEHEFRRLTWSADFADQSRAAELADQMDRPFLINYGANKALNAETKTWSEPDLVERCRSLDIPALIIHGESDPRPAWAVGSLSEALPQARTVLLPGIGHVPWLEGKGEFVVEVRRFLTSS